MNEYILKHSQGIPVSPLCPAGSKEITTNPGHLSVELKFFCFSPSVQTLFFSQCSAPDSILAHLGAASRSRPACLAPNREAGGRLIGGVWGAEPPQGKIKF